MANSKNGMTRPIIFFATPKNQKILLLHSQVKSAAQFNFEAYKVTTYMDPKLNDNK